MSDSPSDDLRVDETYVDRRGGRWVVRAFLRDEGRWFVDDPNGAHVHVMAVSSAGTPRRGRFVKRTTFLKSLVPHVAAAKPIAADGRFRKMNPPTEDLE